MCINYKMIYIDDYISLCCASFCRLQIASISRFSQNIFISSSFVKYELPIKCIVRSTVFQKKVCCRVELCQFYKNTALKSQTSNFQTSLLLSGFHLSLKLQLKNKKKEGKRFLHLLL
jgi:hypothetical protein